MHKIEIPRGALVVALGASGSGKSTWLNAHVKREAIISSDAIRAEVTGNASDQSKDAQVWGTLYERLHDRLGRGLVTVLDSTAASPSARRQAYETARVHGAPVVILHFDTPLETCLMRNRVLRPDRAELVPPDVVTSQWQRVNNFIKQPGDLPEGALLVSIRNNDHVPFIDYAARVVTPRVIPPRGSEKYAIIGDVHGCVSELHALLEQVRAIDPDRKVVFAGDLNDRGPSTLGVFDAIMQGVLDGTMLNVLGNHEKKLAKMLERRYDKGIAWDQIPQQMRLSNGLLRVADELKADEIVGGDAGPRILAFLRTTPYHLVLDNGNLVVSHAGVPEHLIGKEGKWLEKYALYGNPTGNKQPDGFPERRPLHLDYKGAALQVHGHIVIDDYQTALPQVVNNVLDVDTGCVFDGWLTAVLYPELEFVRQRAFAPYWQYGGPIDDR